MYESGDRYDNSRRSRLERGLRQFIAKELKRAVKLGRPEMGSRDYYDLSITLSNLKVLKAFHDKHCPLERATSHSSDDIERRYGMPTTSHAAPTLRAIPAGDTVRLQGYAHRYETEVEIVPGFRELIHRPAFRRAVQEKDDVRLLIGHDPDKILGRTGTPSLTLTDDYVGLRVDTVVNKTAVSYHYLDAIASGHLTQMSFAASDAEELWFGISADAVRREVKSFGKVWDVSVVTYPAYENASIGIASAGHSSMSRIRRAGWRPRSEEDSETKRLRAWAESLS